MEHHELPVPRVLDRSNRGLDLAKRRHPRGKNYRPPLASHISQEWEIRDFCGTDLKKRNVELLEKVDAWLVIRR